MGSSSLEDIKSKSFWRAVWAEMMGTALLVLVACGSCLSKDDPGPPSTEINNSQVSNVFSG